MEMLTLFLSDVSKRCHYWLFGSDAPVRRSWWHPGRNSYHGDSLSYLSRAATDYLSNTLLILFWTVVWSIKCQKNGEKCWSVFSKSLAWRPWMSCFVHNPKETTGCSLNLSPGSAPLHFFFGWLVMNLGSNYLSHRCSSCPQPTDNQLTVVEECCWGMRKYSHLRIWDRNICGTKWL